MTAHFSSAGNYLKPKTETILRAILSVCLLNNGL